MNRRTSLRLTAAASTALTFSPVAKADRVYPDHVVKLVVPRPAGGVVDVIARGWGQAVAGLFGATYVENMGGGGGIIGASSAARAPADGYTLLFGTTSELVLSPILSHQSYDPVASFAPVAIICESPAAIVVNPSIPAANLSDLSHMHEGIPAVSNMAPPASARCQI